MDYNGKLCVNLEKINKMGSKSRQDYPVEAILFFTCSFGSLAAVSVEILEKHSSTQRSACTGEDSTGKAAS